mgnify:CR=1 FL=1
MALFLSILLTKKILVICVRQTHFTLLSFTHTHLIIIFAPSSLKSCFSTGVSGVSGVSGASGALKKLAGWKSGFGWDYSNI